MMPAFGQGLPVRYLPTMHWCRHLQYFEGPLLSEFQTPRGERFLFCWCDSDDTCNRWLVMRVEQREIQRLTSGLIGLRSLITEALPEKYVFVVDVDSAGEYQAVRLTELAEVPANYLPQTDETLDSDIFPAQERTHFPLILSGDWDLEDANTAPRRFMDAYSLIALAQKPVRQRPLPWKGGYSGYNFYNAVRAELGVQQSPSVEAMKFASPGYVKVRGARSIALCVGEVVERYRDGRTAIDDHYASLQRYFRLERLNKKEDIVLNREQEVTIGRLAALVIEGLSAPTWEQVLAIEPDLFRAAKVVTSYYRRIRDVASLVADSRMELPKI